MKVLTAEEKEEQESLMAKHNLILQRMAEDNEK